VTWLIIFTRKETPVLRRSLTALMLGLSLLCASQLHAALPAKKPLQTLTLFSADTIAAAMQNIVAGYENTDGLKLEVVGFSEASRQSTGAELAAASSADVVFSTRSTMDALVAQGRVDSASRVDFGKSFIALVVRAGAEKPDIGSESAFRQTLLSAQSVAYSNNASGLYLTHWLFPHLQMPAGFKSKLIEGTSAGESVASGHAQIGLQQMSELQSVSGVEIVGLIPDPFQQMKLYSAAIVKGSARSEQAGALLAFLNSKAGKEAISKGGLIPAR
jgi:aconitate Delta-isomerase